MILQLFRKRRKWILIDVGTQKDFLLAQGKACVRNHRRVLANIRRMVAWARRGGIPIISTCEVYPANNGPISVDYCVDGTEGQKKVRYTLIPDRVSFPADGDMNLPCDILRRFRQVILHNRCTDPFDEPRIERLLSEITAYEFVVIGANAEGAVEATVLGLLQRGKRVTVVVDALGSSNKRESKLAIRKMKAKGARLIETRKLAGSTHLRQVGACGCKMCHEHERDSEKVEKPVEMEIEIHN